MDESTAFPFRLQLLGDPSLRDAAGQTPPSLGWGKPLALLCLLAVRHEVRRDEVVDLLWRGVDEDRARNAFRQALHRLRGAIGDDLMPQDRERLRLVRSERLSVDLDRFESAASAGRLDEAIASYTGDFLSDASLGEPPFDMWVEQERTRVRSRFRKVLEDAVTAAAATGRWSEAIAQSRKLLAVAPFEAGAAQLAATTLVSAGRRAEARDLLQRFASTLQSELGLPMPGELQSMLARIERQQDKQAETPAPGSAPMSVAPLPFVGREPELAQLVTLCRTASDEAGGLALIEGDASIGKTRLVRELALHVKSLGRFTVLTGRERPAGALLPFGIFAEALRPLVRAPGVVGASRHLLAEAARLLPELRDEIDLPPVTDVDDDAARLRFFEGIAALVDAAAFEQPLVVVLEDLQHLGPSSLDLLSYLAARLTGSAVTFVLTARSAEASQTVLARLRALAGPSPAGSPPHGGRALLVVLSPIASADMHRAASDVATGAGIPPATVDRVVQRAEGVPGRLLELLRRAAAGQDVAALPVDVRDLVAERIQRSSSSQRRLTFVLALIGRPVSASLAAAAAHLPEGAASDAIEALVQQGLAERDGSSVVVPELTARVALDVAGDATRAFLCGWIADALASGPGASSIELARLYALAGAARPAFEHARRAGFSALAMGAVAEAVTLFHSARTFATTPAEQAEIESFLTSLGSGRRQIGASLRRQPADPVDAQPEPAMDAAPTAAARPTVGWERVFPNWRLLLGGAVATLLLSAVVLALRPPSIQTVARGSEPDTLIVADGESGRTIRYVTGGIAQGFSISERHLMPPSDPAWIDSLSRPWTDPVGAPRGGSIALARVTPSGSELYLISSDRRDTTRLAGGQGDARPLAWSPDGRWVLASVSRTLADGSFDTDLFAFAADGRQVIRRPVDTTARRAITEAAWSPDGSRIAWVARLGPDRQLEVFASDADGSGVVNLSRHPADDHHIAWSANGELLAFTSVRDGNAELYAASLDESRLWRLTFDPAQDDGASFSGDGRLVAFESTRGGSSGAYVMPALGGEPRRVGGQPRLSVVGWRRGARRYVDRIRVRHRDRLKLGDTTALAIAAHDQFEEPIATRAAQWTLLDSTRARLVPLNGDDSSSVALVASRPGLARIVASVGRWRHDTAFVRIGDGPVTLVDGAADVRDWLPLGAPRPTTRAELDSTFVLNADREWDSGILLRGVVPLLAGLTLSARLDAPLSRASDAATAVTVALVAPEDRVTIDSIAPQFLKYASFSWNADADRFVYAVGREVFTEPAASVVKTSPFAIRLRLEGDSTVSFSVDGRARWRSTLRVAVAYHARAQVWISGRATGDRVRVGRIQVILDESPNR